MSVVQGNVLVGTVKPPPLDSGDNLVDHTSPAKVMANEAL